LALSDAIFELVMKNLIDERKRIGDRIIDLSTL
jgi:hypothetical protein